MAGRPALTLPALVKSLWLEEAGPVPGHLADLEAEGLLARDGESWRRGEGPRADLLFRMLTFALAYDIDYNPYFEQPLQEFVRRAYDRDHFTADDLPEVSRDRETVARLLANGLLLVFRFHPLTGRMVRHPFLDLLGEFTGIKPVKDGLFARKIKLENVILEKQMALRGRNAEQISHAARLLHPPGSRDLDLSPTRVQRAVKFDLVPENRDLFDVRVKQRYGAAMERMRAEVKEHSPLSVELILAWHGILMEGSGFAGQIRTAEVVVRNNPHFRTAAPRHIERLLQETVAEYRARRRKASGLADVLRLAAWTYNQFLFIHPFEDGNSRTARVVLAHVLRENRAGFEEVPPGFDVRFLQVTKGYRKRNDDDLYQLLLEILVQVINREEVQRARDL